MRILAAFLIALLAQSTQAGPIDWAKHHKRFLLMEGAAVAGASIHAAGLHHCRRTNGVEPCDAHYGEAWGTYAVFTSFSVVAFPAIAEGCWKDNPDAKFCYIFAYGSSAAQTGWGIHEWTITGKDLDRMKKKGGDDDNRASQVQP